MVVVVVVVVVAMYYVTFYEPRGDEATLSLLDEALYSQYYNHPPSSPRFENMHVQHRSSSSPVRSWRSLSRSTDGFSTHKGRY